MSGGQLYEACCFAAAMDPEAGFCNHCGRPLFRCPGFDDCRSLVDASGHCNTCLLPVLTFEENVELEARVGEVATIPFRLRNASPARRPFSVLNIFKREARGANDAVPLHWERIDPDQERGFSVVTEPLESGGAHRLTLLMILVSRCGGIEQCYAFASEILIRVSGSGPTHITQNFDLSNADFGTAGMVVANPNLSTPAERSSAARAGRRDLRIDRAERFEIEGGYRGYAEHGYRVPRNVVFEYSGFAPGDSPPAGPVTSSAPVLNGGRNSRRFDAERNPEPNDLCLRVYKGPNLDAEASRLIPRHLCVLVLQNDRLYLRAREANRLALNGEVMGKGELRQLEDGDQLQVPAGHPGAFSLTVRFSSAAGLVESIRIERSPAVVG